MPTYDYRCAKCGDELEVFQTFAEKPLTKHAGCGGKLAKVLSPAGIVLKGSGFYKNDSADSSRSRSKSRSEAHDAPAKSESSGSESSGAESTSKSPSNGDKKSDGKSTPAKSTGESKSKPESTPKAKSA